MIGTKDQELYANVLTSFTRHNESLAKTIYFLVYYFRGGLSRDDAWAMSPGERDVALDLVKERFKEASELLKHKISPSI